MPNSMKVPKWRFEEELKSLLEAAKNAKSKSTAEGYIQTAWTKANGYYNISESLRKRYKSIVEDVADELGITIRKYK